jgi:hypothetical protein
MLLETAHCGRWEIYDVRLERKLRTLSDTNHHAHLVMPVGQDSSMR